MPTPSSDFNGIGYMFYEGMWVYIAKTKPVCETCVKLVWNLGETCGQYNILIKIMPIWLPNINHTIISFNEVNILIDLSESISEYFNKFINLCTKRNSELIILWISESSVTMHSPWVAMWMFAHS